MSFKCESDVDNFGIQGDNIFHPKNICWQALPHTNLASIFMVGENSYKNMQFIEFSCWCNKKCTINENKACLTRCISLTLSNICTQVNRSNIWKRGFVVLQVQYNHQYTSSYYQNKTKKNFSKALGTVLIVKLSKETRSYIWSPLFYVQHHLFSPQQTEISFWLCILLSPWLVHSTYNHTHTCIPTKLF